MVPYGTSAPMKIIFCIMKYMWSDRRRN